MNEFTNAWHRLSALTAESAIEFKFSGAHHWTHGPEMKKYIEIVLAQETASAIVINLLDYRYEFGNDLFGLFSVGFDKIARRIRPICIVARGQTLTSLKTLLVSRHNGS